MSTQQDEQKSPLGDSSPASSHGDPEKQQAIPQNDAKAADPPPAATPTRSKTRIALLMTSLGVAVFLAALDQIIVATALPAIADSLGASSTTYAWIASAYLIANASSIPVWGRLSDIFGRKPSLLAANVIFMVGSLVAALAGSVGMLIAARAVQGKIRCDL